MQYTLDINLYVLNHHAMKASEQRLVIIRAHFVQNALDGETFYCSFLFVSVLFKSGSVKHFSLHYCTEGVK